MVHLGPGMGRYLLGVAPLMAILSCGGEPVCECATPGIKITIPENLADAVTTITVSDRACNGLSPVCQQRDAQSNCLSYHLAPTTYGNCHIDVTLQNRTYTSDVRVMQRSGCCSGFFADPLAAGTVEISHFHGWP
ncbi:hypothetical protein BH09MYX1_BH09MYX1_37960 [soil metagenome]